MNTLKNISEAPTPKPIAYNVVSTFPECVCAKNAEVIGFDIPDKYTPEADPGYQLRKPILSDVIAWWLIGCKSEGLFLTGPSGAGKSSIIREICARLNLPMQHMVGHNRLEFPEMVSQIHLVNGQTRVLLGPLAKAMKYGHVFLLDEIDLIDPSTNAALNEVLQGSPLTIPETGEVIRPHATFRFIATGNTHGGQDRTGLYHGTVGQNMAFMDRFFVVQVGYPPAEIEIEILRNAVPGVPDEILDKMVQVANHVRDAFMGVNQEADACDITFSTRTLIRWLRYAAYYKHMGTAAMGGKTSFAYALDRALLNRASEEAKAFISGVVQRVFGGV